MKVILTPLGPYPLKKVDELINIETPGAYVLLKKPFLIKGFIDYVGRSDTDLANRILESANEGEYKYFGFRKTKNEIDAYILECEWYHYYNPPDNINHPASPSGKYLICPICRCCYR